MSLFHFILGVLIVILIWILHTWISKGKFKLNWLSWIGIVITSVLGLFTFAWTFSCILEGEIQAAGMGLIIFGGAALIAFGLTRRKILRDRRKAGKLKETSPQKSES